MARKRFRQAAASIGILLAVAADEPGAETNFGRPDQPMIEAFQQQHAAKPHFGLQRNSSRAPGLGASVSHAPFGSPIRQNSWESRGAKLA
jgi:hypothetical protein